MIFTYSRRIHFYETDAMGIVHHAVYLNLFEETRVELLRCQGVFSQYSLEKINYPLLNLQVEYKKPLYFDDEAKVQLRVSADKVRISFDYEISTKRFPEAVAFGKTTHVAMDMETRKPIKVPDFIQSLIKQG